MQLIVGNDDMYFVFADYIYKVSALLSKLPSLFAKLITWLPNTQVLLPFLRDPEVIQLTGVRYDLTAIANFDSLDVIFPPSGVIPFHGFSMYGR